jgi:hypothetical protein
MPARLALIAAVFALASCSATPQRRQVLIIGGQSNAALLIRQIPGAREDTPGNYTVRNDSLGLFGYARGTTSIAYWLSDRNRPLLDLIATHCSDQATLIWYQGESDASPRDDSTSRADKRLYADRLRQFFAVAKANCPTLSIALVLLGPTTEPAEQYDFAFVRQVQRSAGYPVVDTSEWHPELVDAMHFTEPSYRRLLGVLQRRWQSQAAVSLPANPNR